MMGQDMIKGADSISTRGMSVVKVGSFDGWGGQVGLFRTVLVFKNVHSFLQEHPMRMTKNKLYLV